MKEMATSLTVARLIAIKREELDQYRQDLARLEQIVSAARTLLDTAIENERNFLDEIRQNEHAETRLDPPRMIQNRRYLIHLQNETKQTQEAADQAVTQRDQAHQCLKTAHSEMRSLERLAERRQVRAHSEQQRLDYLRADDQEIARNISRGDIRAEY